MTYDLAFSFIGVQRPYVRRVNDILQGLGITTYFDEDRPETLLARDLGTTLPDVYGSGTVKHCVVFLSEQYLESEYTRLELKAALQHRSRGNDDYLIPIRCDDAPLPDVLRRVAYIDARVHGPTFVAQQLAAKLGRTRFGRGTLRSEVVLQFSEKGSLDIDLLSVTAKDSLNSRSDRAGDELAISVKFPDCMAAWRTYAVDWITENKARVLQNGAASEEAFEQVDMALAMALDDRPREIVNGVRFFLDYCLENPRVVPFGANEIAISALVTFAETKFHQAGRLLDAYRINGMAVPSWRTAYTYGKMSWGCDFAESLALNSRSYERIPIWFQADATFDNTTMLPTMRPYIPADAFLFGEGKVTSSLFAQVIAPQIVANGTDCAPYIIQGFFSSDFDYERVKIRNRQEGFIEKSVGVGTNISHLVSTEEKKAFLGRVQSEINGLDDASDPRGVRRFLTAEMLFR